MAQMNGNEHIKRTKRKKNSAYQIWNSYQPLIAGNSVNHIDIDASQRKHGEETKGDISVLLGIMFKTKIHKEHDNTERAKQEYIKEYKKKMEIKMLTEEENTLKT